MFNPNQNDTGWIRLYRKMSEWQWYGEPNIMAVFIHLLLNANHKDGFHFGTEVKRGQLLTSENSIMQCIKIERGALRVCLKKLEKSGEITRKTTNRHSIITICKFDYYQRSAGDAIPIMLTKPIEQEKYKAPNANKRNRTYLSNGVPQSDHGCITALGDERH